MAGVASHSADEIHPEDREIYQKLAKLQGVYTQVFGLRTLLPDKLVNPTQAIIDNADAVAPQKVASNLKDAATTGSKNIKRFKSDYQSEDMRTLWQKVNSAEFPQGADVWSQNYSSFAKASGSEPFDLVKNESEENRSGSPAQSDDADILKKFHESNPKLVTRSLEDGHILPLELAVGGVDFIVALSKNNEARGVQAKLKGSDIIGGEWKEISEHIEDEHATETLGSMLSLLGSYTDVKNTPCQKCGKVFDEDLQFALVRKRKEGETNHNLSIWIPLHQSCVS